jgi:hypothetical protein
VPLLLPGARDARGAARVLGMSALIVMCTYTLERQTGRYRELLPTKLNAE